MFGRVGEGASALELMSAGWVPALALAVVGIAAVVGYTLAFIRGQSDGTGRTIVQLAVVLMLVIGGWWALAELHRRDLAAEQHAFEAKAFELTARALAPGSPLGCLDPVAGESIEDACEKALFATPETTAAAVSYVAAQLSLLAAAGEQARRSGLGYGSMLTNVRRTLEADRFGIVAYVLAGRDGCTPDQCAAFAFLQGTGRVSANLAERPFEVRLKAYAASWPARAAGVPVAAGALPATTPPAAPLAAAKTPLGNLYFPSSTSIPPVNIMTAEPRAQGAQDATGAANAARKGAAGAAAPRQSAPSANAAPTPPAPTAPAPTAPAPRAEPLQLAPNAR